MSVTMYQGRQETILHHTIVHYLFIYLFIYHQTVKGDQQGNAEIYMFFDNF